MLPLVTPYYFIWTLSTPLNINVSVAVSRSLCFLSLHLTCTARCRSSWKPCDAIRRARSRHRSPCPAIGTAQATRRGVLSLADMCRCSRSATATGGYRACCANAEPPADARRGVCSSGRHLLYSLSLSRCVISRCVFRNPLFFIWTLFRHLLNLISLSAVLFCMCVFLAQVVFLCSL